jgi:hypothetical protein
VSKPALIFFPQALRLFGATVTEQAKAIQLSPRSVRRLSEDVPDYLARLLDQPILLAALLLDALVLQYQRARSDMEQEP